MKNRYQASDEFISWAASLGALITECKSKYGSGADLLESDEWDDSRTDFAIQMLHGLKRSVSTFEKEMKEHVRQKRG